MMGDRSDAGWMSASVSDGVYWFAYSRAYACRRRPSGQSNICRRRAEARDRRMRPGAIAKSGITKNTLTATAVAADQFTLTTGSRGALSTQ